MNSLTLCASCVIGAMAMLAAINSKGRPDVDPVPAIAATLDDFHAAASRADGDRYFAYFAPDAVFLGTDANERWNLQQFKAFAKPYFDQGQGWTYVAIEGKRFISLSADQSIAWFDELLSNDKYGTCRGTGVLRNDHGDWKIVQYNLSFMIPNDRAKEVVALIKAKAQ